MSSLVCRGLEGPLRGVGGSAFFAAFFFGGRLRWRSSAATIGKLESGVTAAASVNPRSRMSHSRNRRNSTLSVSAFFFLVLRAHLAGG